MELSSSFHIKQGELGVWHPTPPSGDPKNLSRYLVLYQAPGGALERQEVLSSPKPSQGRVSLCESDGNVSLLITAPTQELASHGSV